MPADVLTVVSYDSKYDPSHSNAVRERFVVLKALGGEGGQTVVIEKFAPGRFGSADKVLAVTSNPVSTLPGIRIQLKEALEKNPESTYGCCEVKNIKRSEVNWEFEVQVGKDLFRCVSSVYRDKGKIAISSCSK